MESKVCCFSGYQPDKLPFACDKADPAYNAFENKLLDQILCLVQQGYTDFYTGMAEGFDIIAAELVLAAQTFSPQAVLRLTCVIPFRSQTAGWPRDWQERYRHVLNEADAVIVLAEHYYRGCYDDRNRYMIDHSDLLLTYYDTKAGGIQNVVNYAHKKGIEVCNLAEEGNSTLKGAPIFSAWKGSEKA